MPGTILTSLTWVLLDIGKCYLGLIHFWMKWWIWDCFLGPSHWNQCMWVSDCHILLTGVRAYLYVGLSQCLVHGMWRKACCWAPFMKVMSSYGVEVLQFQVGLVVSTVIMWWMVIRMFWDVRWEGSVNCYWLMGFRMVRWWGSMTFGRCCFCSLFHSNCYQLWLLQDFLFVPFWSTTLTLLLDYSHRWYLCVFGILFICCGYSCSGNFSTEWLPRSYRSFNLLKLWSFNNLLFLTFWFS